MVFYLISSSPDLNEPRTILFVSSMYPTLPFFEEGIGDWVGDSG